MSGFLPVTFREKIGIITSMMLEQERIIEKIKSLCQEDERVVSAMLYGSFALGEGDRFSDVDCFLFFRDDILPPVDKLAWVEQIRPVVLFYQNEFGNYETIFELSGQPGPYFVRAEFHFESVKGMNQFAGLVGDIYFPSIESTILVDKTGELEKTLQPLIGTPHHHDTPADAQFLLDSFLNWSLFGFNLLGRGEWARGGEVLVLIQDYLLRMARVLEGSGQRWITPTRSAEKELSAASYARFKRCTAGIEPEAITAAYWSAWEWGQEMSAALAERHRVVFSEDLANRLTAYFKSLNTMLNKNS